MIAPRRYNLPSGRAFPLATAHNPKLNGLVEPQSKEPKHIQSSGGVKGSIQWMSRRSFSKAAPAIISQSPSSIALTRLSVPRPLNLSAYSGSSFDRWGLSESLAGINCLNIPPSSFSALQISSEGLGETQEIGRAHV